MSENKSFISPTTPGLFIIFRAYIIELICLNIDKKLIPRFWNDTKYWGPKFKRECRGFSNLQKLLNDFSFDEPLVQNAIIASCKKLNIKSLSAKVTTNKLAKKIKDEYDNMVSKRELMIENQPIDTHIDKDFISRNSKFTESGKETKLSKIRRIE